MSRALGKDDCERALAIAHSQYNSSLSYMTDIFIPKLISHPIDINSVSLVDVFFGTSEPYSTSCRK